ncbi:MAG: gliding motility lipoprotein GldD [Bacteroidota bacterium]
MLTSLSHTKAIVWYAVLITAIVSASACNDADYVPKPRGYLRLDLPEQTYRSLDSTLPFTFEYSKHARISSDRITMQNPNWFNIAYPGFKAKVHVSYKDLDDAVLYNLQRDAHEMAYKHAPKAVGIREIPINRPQQNLYGLGYGIEGKEAASPFQFYLTDSTHHFIRGALYFNLKPNNDSLGPVIDFILDDIDHLISTFQWKN